MSVTGCTTSDVIMEQERRLPGPFHVWSLATQRERERCLVSSFRYAFAESLSEIAGVCFAGVVLLRSLEVHTCPFLKEEPSPPQKRYP